jgi:RNA polymerase sigma factor (sigma-70 family)
VAVTQPLGFAVDIRWAAAGDADAWQRLVTRFRPVFERIADEFYIAETPELSAADLTQEAWLRVYQVLPQFVGHQDDEATERMFLQWLRQSARNAMLNIMAARRTQRRQPSTPIRRLDAEDPNTEQPAGAAAVPSADASPSSIHRRNDERSQVQAAIAEIPDSVDRQIIEASFVAGESLNKIATQLGLPYDDVRKRFHRTLDFLQSRLESSQDK